MSISVTNPRSNSPLRVGLRQYHCSDSHLRVGLRQYHIAHPGSNAHLRVGLVSLCFCGSLYSVAASTLV